MAYFSLIVEISVSHAHSLSLSFLMYIHIYIYMYMKLALDFCLLTLIRGTSLQLTAAGAGIDFAKKPLLVVGLVGSDVCIDTGV